MAKDMIISPLEQFNICPLWGISLSDISSLEILYANLLLWVWSISPTCASSSCPTSLFFIAPAVIKGMLFVHSAVADVIQAIILPSSRFVFHVMASVVDIYREAMQRILFIWSPVAQAQIIEPNGGSALSLQVPFLLSISSAIASCYFMISDVLLELWYMVYSNSIEQFFIKNKEFLIFSLNTSSFWLLFITAFTAFIFHATLANAYLIPANSWQATLEMIYGVILGAVYDNAGQKLIKYFPLIFTTFIIILVCNLLGMIPYSFTVTSHIIVTFCAALAGFIGLNILGVARNGTHFISLFFPPGAPMALAPLLVFIELVSYVFRVLSLSIRLFANLMSGHTLLKILSGFAWAAVSFWGIYLIPLAIIFLVTGLELGIAFIQAYIFAVLLCIYINDAFNLH